MTASRSRTVAADMLTPIGAYAALARDGEACLLESVESGGRISRHSFIGLQYAAAQSFDAGANLYRDIRAFIEPYRRIGGEAAPLGGALVAFAYDAARPAAHLVARKPSVPEMPDAFVAIPSVWLIFDHFTDRLTIWACGEETELEASIDAIIERLFAHRASPPQPVSAGGDMRATLTRDRYLERASRVKAYITDGEVYQLQLGIRFSAPLHGTPFDLYRALRSANPSPYMFYVQTGFGTLLGASPEFLVRLEGTRARIRPLAGTRPRGRDEAHDVQTAAELLADEKERAEHVMLVDLGRNDLGRVCRYGSVRVTELLQIERYSHVMHIVSDLTGELRPECDGLDLFAAGFPAGTVTGTPKIRAMQLIDELEPVARGFYSGSIGRWSFNGDFDSCITLRSVHVRDGVAHWQASAGIVSDSNIEAEYDEVLHKTRIVRETLGL